MDGFDGSLAEYLFRETEKLHHRWIYLQLRKQLTVLRGKF
jgi:hypothetical protein